MILDSEINLEQQIPLELLDIELSERHPEFSSGSQT